MKHKWLREDNSVNMAVMIIVIVPAQTVIYLYTMVHCNPFCTFQDMARTGNSYEKNGYGEITQ